MYTLKYTYRCNVRGQQMSAEKQVPSIEEAAMEAYAINKGLVARGIPSFKLFDENGVQVVDEFYAASMAII